MTQTNSTSDSVVDSGIVDRIRSAASTQLAAQKDRATDTLGSVVTAVRQSTQTLRDHQQDALAQYVERAADQIDQLSAGLRDRDVNRLISDTQQFARRQPALFIGAAFAAGVVAVRFLKSSGRTARGQDWRRPAASGEYGRPSLQLSGGESQHTGGR